MKRESVKRNHKPGFILPLTLSIIGLAVALVTYMANNGRAFTPAARMMLEREKARMLARSGIEIAMSQISLPDKQQAPPKDEKDAAPIAQEKQQETLFAFVVPRLNAWQTFKLTSAVEGMAGEIGVCVMSEEGKLNLNQLFDPATGTLIESLKSNETAAACMRVLFERIEKATGGKEMLKAFEAFLKKRKTKLDDVTELLMIKEFEVFKDTLFYNPPDKVVPKEVKNTIYLTDIFTIWSGKKSIQPWLLSDSMCGVLELTRAKEGAVDEKQKIVAEISKAMPESLTWPDGWNKNLKLLYGKDFASLPKGIELLLDTKFEPMIFSVICYGKVGKTTQKVFAIVERVKTSTEKDKQQLNVKLKKLYWI
jgi:hypothetical protein